MFRMVGLLFVLSAASAWGQIQVPEKNAPHAPIVAMCAEGKVPPGAEVKMQWGSSDGVTVLPAREEASVHIWAPPGKHWVSCSVVWVEFESITTPDGKVIRSFKKWDWASHRAQFEVSGTPTPTPNPPGPTPNPPTPTPNPPGPTPNPPTPNPPAPDIPTDEFGDLSRRVNDWVLELPAEHRGHRKTLATVYARTAKRYAEGELISPADASAAVGTELAKLPPEAFAAWKSSWAPRLNSDLKGRWPLVRDKFAAWMECVAIGLDR